MRLVLTWDNLFVVVLVWSPFCFLVARMARSYERSTWGWFLLSVFFSPVAGFVFLIVAGVPHSAVAHKAKVDRIRREHPDRASEAADLALHDATCPGCGSTVNIITRDGLRSEEGEPWQLNCATCGAEVAP